MPEAARSRPDGALAPLPGTYAGFRNLHAGETMLVCGLGTSLNLLAEPERFLTIGVNDIGRRFDPDYLLVLNTRGQFSRERFAHIAGSRARAVFSHLKLDISHPNFVQVVLGSYGAPDFSRPERLAHTRNSPYVAVCLAVYMGARRIGLIGVDFTDHHFFGETGRHPLAGTLSRMEQEYRDLVRACAAVGVELVNLSPHSRLSGLPRMELDAFAGEAKSPRSLRIVSYATTPVAGVPHVLTRCIEARTPHHAQTVWPRAGYGNGVEFGGGIETTRNAAAGRQALEAADVVILHNGFVAPADRALMETKPTLTLAHNYKWNVDDRFVRKGAPGLVVAQYQAALPEFDGWTPVPQPMPLWEADFRPEPKGEIITIAYTPSGKHESYPRNHRLYWHGKGYETTLRVLDHLSRRHGIRLETIRGAQVSHAASLAMKRRAHIVIDECVTGSYHRNSLEGLAAGAVVVNGLGLVPEIADVLRRCLSLPEADMPPFVPASLDTLERVLEALISEGPQALAQRGLAGRQWLERHWNFHRHWGEVWLPALDRAIGDAPRPRPRPAPPPAPAPVARPQEPIPPPAAAPACAGWSGEGEVTVIIPHRGRDRLPLLDATLSRLRAVKGIAQVLVVELAGESVAAEACARLGAQHLFCRTADAFEKGRALAMGTPFASTPFVLWLDNDLILPEGFVTQAVRELRARGLDSLTPWHTQHYLSEPESAAVMAGTREPDTCTPLKTVQSGRGWVGGAELVRHAFLLEHGGIPPGFLGWGGEDNAWIIKARLLGTQATSREPEQVVRHLYHPTSNGYAQGKAMRENPHYPDNLARMRRMQALRGRADFLRHFPPPSCHPAPWEGTRRIACPSGREATGTALKTLYGPAVEMVSPSVPHDLCLEAGAAPSPHAAALAAVRRLAGSGPPPAGAPPASPAPTSLVMAAARVADFALPEFAAVRRLGPLPRARAWELPFALWSGRVPPGGRVIDRSMDPVALQRLVEAAHPSAHYRHVPAGTDPDGWRALDVPDAGADLVTCLNTLDSLPPSAWPVLVRDMARMLRPGGRLVVTCDHHFEAFFRRENLPSHLASLRRITPADVLRLAGETGLAPLGPPPALPSETDTGLFRNIEPCPHAVFGMTFTKPGAPVPPPVKIALAFPKGGEAQHRMRREAEALTRLGHNPVVLRPEGDPGPWLDGDFPVKPGIGGALAMRSGYTAAARAAGCTALLTMDEGTGLPPLMAHAMAIRLAGLSSDVCGLTWDGAPDAAIAPVLGLRLGPPRTGGGGLTLWRLPAPETGTLLSVDISP